MSDPVLVTYASAQDGHLTVGVWDDTAIILSQATIFQLGFIFVVPLTFDASRTDLPVDPPIFQSLNLRLQGGINIVTFPIVSFVPEANPANYSALLLPGGRNELRLTTTPTPSLTTSAAGLITIPVPLTTAFMSTVRNSNWSGRIALSMSFGAGTVGTNYISAEGAIADPTLLAPAFDAMQAPFHTGHEWPEPRRARARHDPKSGMPIFTDELVVDGWTKLHVHPDNWDPEDPLIHRRPLPAREGDIDDKAV